MLALAAERADGVHPYLVPVEHTRLVRETRAGALVAEELTVVLGGDDDVADGGSDRLIDALYAYGTPGRIAERIDEYRGAGADHVCLRVVVDDPLEAEELPLPAWRELAALVVA